MTVAGVLGADAHEPAVPAARRSRSRAPAVLRTACSLSRAGRLPALWRGRSGVVAATWHVACRCAGTAVRVPSVPARQARCRHSGAVGRRGLTGNTGALARQAGRPAGQQAGREADWGRFSHRRGRPAGRSQVPSADGTGARGWRDPAQAGRSHDGPGRTRPRPGSVSAPPLQGSGAARARRRPRYPGSAAFSCAGCGGGDFHGSGAVLQVGGFLCAGCGAGETPILYGGARAAPPAARGRRPPG